MKIRNSTLLMILGILFIMVCGLAYFFYTKYKSMTKYINERFTNYNYNIQNQMVELLNEYKSFVSQNKPVIQSREEEEKINDFIADLETVDEQDIELEKEIQNATEKVENNINKLPTITEEDMVMKDLSDDEDLSDLPTIDNDDNESFEEICEESDVEEVDESDDEVVEEVDESDDEVVEEVDESDDEAVEEEEEVVEEVVEEVEDDLLSNGADELNLDMSDNELDNEVDSFQLDEVEDKNQETIQIELPPRCSFVFKRGKNKGNQCDRKAGEDGRCTKHK